MNDPTPEEITCNYSKTREGWLEIALPKEQGGKTKKRLFIPSHRIFQVVANEIEDSQETNRR